MKRNKRSTSEYVAFLGVMLGLAMVFSYIETMIPVSFAIPGIKLGLANIVTMVILYVVGWKEAVILALIRIMLSTILFGNMSMLIYSLAGGALSIIIMILLKRLRFFSVTGVSVCGGVGHNAGQLLAAMIVLENQNIIYYLPVLIISGAATGIVTGIAAAFITKRVRPFF